MFKITQLLVKNNNLGLLSILSLLLFLFLFTPSINAQVTDINVFYESPRVTSIWLRYDIVGGNSSQATNSSVVMYPPPPELPGPGPSPQYCQSTATTDIGCQLTLLSPNTTYTISISAQNNGVVFTKNITYHTYDKITNGSLSIVGISFTSFVLTIVNQVGGYPDGTTWGIYIPSNDGIPFICMATSNPLHCEITLLQPNTSYTIQGTIHNDGQTFTLTPLNASTYAYLTDVNGVIQQSETSLNISYSSVGGAPGMSTYQVYLNISDSPICPNTTQQYCIYQYPNNVYPSTTTFTPTIQAYNVNRMVQRQLSPLTTYSYPLTGVDRSVLVGPNSINLTWTELEGGQPNATTYETTIQYGGGPSIVKCRSTTVLSCEFNNLISGLNYNYQIAATNSFFTPVIQNGDNITLQEPNEDCKNNCSNNGLCNIGSCECNNGWDGPQCDIELEDDASDQSNEDLFVLTPNVNRPSLSILFNDIITYQIELIKLVEIEPLNNTEVKSIDLTTLLDNQWQINGTTYYFSGNTNLNITSHITISFQLVTLDDGNQQSFAGQIYSIPFGSVKYTITVEDWEFTSPDNQFQVFTSISHPNLCSNTPSNQSTFTVENNLSNSLLIGDYQASSVYIQGKLFNSAILDTIPSKIMYEHPVELSNGTQSTVIARTPSFTQSLIIEPSFHLIDVNNCGNGSPQSSGHSDSDWKIATGILVGVGGAAFIAGGVIYVIKKRKGTLTIGPQETVRELKTVKMFSGGKVKKIDEF